MKIADIKITGIRIADIGIANLADYCAPGWNTKPIDGVAFDEQFQIKGIPYSWFLKRLLSLHTIPPQLNTKQKIEKMLRGEEVSYTWLDLGRTALLSRLFFANENSKIIASKEKQGWWPSEMLFLSYLEHIHPQTGELYRLQNLLDTFQQKGGKKPMVLYADSQSRPFSGFIKQKSKANNFPLLYSQITSEMKDKARFISAELSARWKNLEEEQKAARFGSADIWNSLRAAFDFYCSPQFLYLVVLYYEAFKAILQEQKTKVVAITSQNSIFERCLNAAASHLNISTVLLQHGAAMGSINPELREPYLVAVFSPKYKKALEEQKVPAKNVAVVGPLIFDEIYPFINMKKKTEFSGMNILILTVPFIEQGIFRKKEHFSYIQKIVQESMAIPYSKITIKLHPREKYLKEYENLITREGWANITAIQNDQRKVLYELMSQSDIIINFSSTVAVEAMILDKPLITITFPNFQNPFNEVIRRSEASVEVGIRDNLAAALKKLLEDAALQKKLQQKRRAFVKKYCGKVEGKATERTAELLEKVAVPSK